MDRQEKPPQRARPEHGSARRPPSSIPAKRSADTQEEAWVADEDRFVLEQAKKKAAIRVKAGRAKPIDWLAVILRILDTTNDAYGNDDDEDAEFDIVDPEGVLESLDDAQLTDLEKDIDTYVALETDRRNREYWTTMKVICKDKRTSSHSVERGARGVASVSADVDRLLGPKTLEELEALEKQIRRKLDSNEPIDVDYWEHLLRSLIVWKAKARLRRVSEMVINSRLQELRRHQQQNARDVKRKFGEVSPDANADSPIRHRGSVARSSRSWPVPTVLDPESSLKLRPEDKTLGIMDEKAFLAHISAERRKILKLGYVPIRQTGAEKPSSVARDKGTDHSNSSATSRFAPAGNEDFSQAGLALYEREVARGVSENEEIFAGEEEVVTTNKSQWMDKYKPRRPRYFNRVQMGYEWNKYNQTHYDHDNPPPKVVQGYKFNIFYPHLIDKTKAPTYRIERENGRKRGQSFARAGEEDTCLIRFIAGPPYEDVAFRIVDKEWDYSAKRERGFKSSFDRGILQLHFQFKKIYYRK
ncbi:cactin [Saccharata proteae CBS 121410]|uniref:Splicing factor Cactin n=1 Tax=Saccharata proteae CBS 121410 TaxID=1314787 RepID=A0A9P4LWX5_9PEZI|nr:cactin [Saccharata proteae CBS 121410]